MFKCSFAISDMISILKNIDHVNYFQNLINALKIFNHDNI